jgi:hypothetical protein
MNQSFLPKSGKQTYLFLLNKPGERALVMTVGTATVAEQALRSIEAGKNQLARPLY